MEQCKPPSGHEHPWKDATMKRRAWAQSRDSWQAPESQDDSSEDPVPTEPMEEKPAAAKEPGRIPQKIASWLQDCRTPLGASLDEQSGTLTKGVPKNGCSFEDDLSLGAEANHLQINGTKTEVPCYGVPAKDKRSQFKHKGRSMNSTGSGKSNTTVSSGLSSLSVSELLDLYEEDPEEILYNLGFGREEPNIASKVPSRFLNGSSSARGIDITVYLTAQLQRMELENPNYALTSRFRQIEVLTTVANAFSSLYSQVSGLPVQKIGNTNTSPGVGSVGGVGGVGGGGTGGTEFEGEVKEPPPIARTHSHSTLNAVRMLKRSLTRHSLLASSSSEGGTVVPATNSDPGSPGNGAGGGSVEEHTKPQKAYRKKDSPSLATVAEEAGQGSTESLGNGDAPEPAATNPAPAPATTAASPAPESQVDSLSPKLSGEDQPKPQGEGLPVDSVDSQGPPILGMEIPVVVSISGASEESDGSGGGGLEGVQAEEAEIQRAITSTPDKEPTNLLPNPLLDHLRTSPQARESFEMDELQEDEPGTRSASRAGSELLRTASQQSDSSGFAEDPSTDCSTNYLKIQESSDSCDSETTVTSHAGDSTTPLAADPAAFEPDAQAVLETHGEVEEQEEEKGEKEVPTYNVHQFPRVPDSQAPQPASSADEPSLATTTTEYTTEASPPAEPGVSSEISSPMEAPLARPASSLSNVPEGSKLGASGLVHTALHRAQERSFSVNEDRTGLAAASAAARAQELRKARLGRLQRSSSLPASLLSPSRVISSLRIQLGHGSVRHCTSPSFSYRYTPDPDGALEVGSIKEEGHNEEGDVDEAEEGRPSCRTTLIIKSPTTGAAAVDGPLSKMAPVYPSSVLPGHLTLSSTSLYSGSPQDWPPQRTLGEAGGWSSVPNLSLSQPHAPSPTPHHHLPHLPHLPHPSSQYPPAPTGSPYNSLNSSFSGAFPQTPGSCLTPSPTPFFTPPQSGFFTPPQSAAMLNSAPYGPGAQGLSPYGSPYAPHHQQLQHLHQPDGRYSSPLPPSAPSPVPSYSPLVHPHSAPYSLPYSTPPPSRPGQPYNPRYSGPPCFPFPHEPATSPAPSSTEMQLRRVLHEIRGTVQNLAQASTPTPTEAFSPQRSVQTLYEELQMRKRSLSLFRTQMMDLELALMSQQSQVYQHLSQEKRLELEQLQCLRSAVRKELQELELQVEDRLLVLNEQLRTTQHPALYRHPMARHRGQSFDSLSNASALEPVSDLLREQLYLQSELGYEGSLSRATTPMSGRSSGTVSPVRSHWTATSGHTSPQRGAVYRATVSLTPAPPPRPGVEPPEEEEEEEEEEQQEQEQVDGEGRAEGCSSLAWDQGSQAAINPHLLEERGREGGAAAAEGGGGGGGGGRAGAENPHLQQLIKEIKDSIADEIRQEIVSELLAAVSPRRVVAVSREQP